MTHNELRSRILTSTMVLGLVLAVGVLASSVIAKDAQVEPAYTPDNLIRLHVIANSNTPFDQDLKLSVRDAILAVANQVFQGVKDRNQALRLLEANEDKFLAPARRVITASGQSYPIRLEVGDFQFPEKTYGDLTLPAGEYLAARFVIGEGAGRNWWCVLFPPLCLLESTEGAKKLPNSQDPLSDQLASEVQLRFKYVMKDRLFKYDYAKQLRELLQPTLAWLRVAPTGPIGVVR